MYEPASKAEGRPKPAKADSLGQRFDCVIMLTQSDWCTEPRSNRYHYATRFAGRLPTYFVQPEGSHTAVTETATEIDGLTLVNCAWWDEAADAADAHEPRFRQVSGERDASLRPTPAAALKAYFEGKNVRRPLLWIYNPNYLEFAALWSDALKVFHATEDYTLDAASGRYFDDSYQALVYQMLGACDLLVAVSEAVRSNYLIHSGYSGPSLTLTNGCDFSFWAATGASDFHPPAARKPEGILGLLAPARSRPVVLYQGGVNGRLDFALIEGLARRMPDFDFVFCGPLASGATMEGWEACDDRPNLRATGMIPLEAVAGFARAAVVGIIPYRSTPLIAVSLPLKAYEYLACGLPVVTTPIAALAAQPELFRFATTAAEYEAAIRALAPSRADPVAVERRLAAARRADYDQRFAELEVAIGSSVPTSPSPAADRAETIRPIRIFGAEHVDCQEAWREAGADLAVEEGVARITTPRDPWNFAATVRIDVPRPHPGASMVRLSVTVADVAGDVTVSLLDEADGRIRFETPLGNVSGSAEYCLESGSLRSGLLLFRNGGRGSRGVVRFLRATLSV